MVGISVHRQGATTPASSVPAHAPIRKEEDTVRNFVRAIVAVVMLATVLTGATASSASNPAQGADIKAVGAGKTDVGTVQFDVSAHTGPNGDFGTVAVTESLPMETISYRVDLDCVHVNGQFRSATVSGTVKKVSPTSNTLGIEVGDRQAFEMVDNGEPTPPVPVDWFRPLHQRLASPGACKTSILVFAPRNVTQGNVVVKAG